MSCYSVVTSVETDIKASLDETLEALRRMGIRILSQGPLGVVIEGGKLIRYDVKQAWQVQGSLDLKKFGMQVQRAKALATAKREGYRVVEDRIENGRLVIKLAAE